jgi:site-specific recombinase XerC
LLSCVSSIFCVDEHCHTARHVHPKYRCQFFSNLVRIIQVLLGHAKLDTTALYTRVANTTIRSVTSPLDRLAPLSEERARPAG